MSLHYRIQLFAQLSFIFVFMLVLAATEAHGDAGLVPVVGVDVAGGFAAVAAPTDAGARADAAVIASLAPVIVPEVLPSALPELAPAVAAAITNVKVASSTGGSKLAAWLVAGSSVLWALIAIARRKGQLLSRKAVIGAAFVASMLGVAGAQLLLGVPQAEAWLFALTGPSAVWLNALLRAFGWNFSRTPRP